MLLLSDAVCVVWCAFQSAVEDRGTADAGAVDCCEGLCYAYESVDWMGVGDSWARVSGH